MTIRERAAIGGMIFNAACIAGHEGKFVTNVLFFCAWVLTWVCHGLAKSKEDEK